ncbi:GDNF family receptor alpha-like [Bagarius yarrelli]|uniref:GDNF family receptor alpha-like n=1 Tax=Bagarius yarrelli TaxID=175774 RepID=A0A556U733_BAGYA|nr:GDNF family receptor alpha-like [Bagarius yarrelli]
MRTALVIDSSCQSPEGCNVTLQAIFGHLTDCVCADENPCSILQLLASFCQFYLDGDDSSRPATQQTSSQASALHPPLDRHLPLQGHKNNLKNEWEESRMLASDMSCVRSMTLCIQDETCNRQLVPFVQSCSSSHCQEKLCRLAARRLYSNLPETMTEMLVFCQCESDDQDCHHFQAMLNSNSCNNDQTGQWNCLEMLDNCTGETICRFGHLKHLCILRRFISTYPALSPSAVSIDYHVMFTQAHRFLQKATLISRLAVCVNRRAFEAFLSKCFGIGEVSLGGYSTTELLHVIDLDFFVGGNKECTSAFVATMGTVLQSGCTCHGLDHHTLYRCNVLKQAIHNRSYFSKYSSSVNICHSQKYLCAELLL